jgi:hypothetical protein
MPEPDARLGVTFDDNKLYYAVSASARPSFIERIGQIDFSFDPIDSLSRRDPDTFPALCETLTRLIKEEDTTRTCILYPSQLECWSIVPKSVHDQQDEREAHLAILMQGTDLRRISPEWYMISNRDFKLLSVRRKQHLESFSFLVNGPVSGKLFSEFQIGEKWMEKSHFHGSFLTVSSTKGVLSIASFLLGKLRAATFLTYDDVADLPYLWLQQSSHLQWMSGMHEQILVFGRDAGRIVDEMQSYWDDASDLVVMDSLEKMGFSSDEETFGFPLERAFPATLLSVF